MQFRSIIIACLAHFYGMPNNFLSLFKSNLVFSSQNNRSVDLLGRHCIRIMGVRIRLLLLHWLDKKGKSKENKIRKNVLIAPNILVTPLKIIYFPYIFFLICFIGFNLVKSHPPSLSQFITGHNLKV
jgi:hypothetical protein